MKIIVLTILLASCSTFKHENITRDNAIKKCPFVGVKITNLNKESKPFDVVIDKDIKTHCGDSIACTDFNKRTIYLKNKDWMSRDRGRCFEYGGTSFNKRNNYHVNLSEIMKDA